jgi:hypothetical protein
MPIPFRPIARLLIRTLRPAPQVDIDALRDFFNPINPEGQDQGVLVTVNHYHAPDFSSWWFVILISAIMPKHINWVVASGWTNSGWLTGFTHWLFPRGARLLGFTPMPAMPPDPEEVEQRAEAVRRVLDYARQVPHPVIGMSPEGRDFPGGTLGSLPPGAGRFLYLLIRYCPITLPAGVWKENGIIHLKFGSPYSLVVPANLSTQARDRLVGEVVMHHIAQCLPVELRGEYE